MDKEGYPDEEDLKRIREWPHRDDHEALMAHVRALWCWAGTIPWIWQEDDMVDEVCGPVRRYRISTGGWSGNESLIGAMKENFFFWNTAWYSMRRGGHYEFRVRR